MVSCVQTPGVKALRVLVLRQWGQVKTYCMVYASPSMLARGSAEGPRRLMIWRICCLNSLSCETLESSVDATSTRPDRISLQALQAVVSPRGLTVKSRDLRGVNHGRDRESFDDERKES